MSQEFIHTRTYVASRWSSAWWNSSDAYMRSPPASCWTRAHCVMFSCFKYWWTVFTFWLKRVAKWIAILFWTGCGIVDGGRWGGRRTYLESKNPTVVRKEIWVWWEDVHDGWEKEPRSTPAFFGRRESSSSRLYKIFICDNVADATTKLSILEKGWRLLRISGNSRPQNRSVGNAQYVHTGPAASIPSTTWRRAWMLNGQADRRLGEYW